MSTDPSDGDPITAPRGAGAIRDPADATVPATADLRIGDLPLLGDDRAQVLEDLIAVLRFRMPDPSTPLFRNLPSSIWETCDACLAAVDELVRASHSLVSVLKDVSAAGCQQRWRRHASSVAESALRAETEIERFREVSRALPCPPGQSLAMQEVDRALHSSCEIMKQVCALTRRYR